MLAIDELEFFYFNDLFHEHRTLWNLWCFLERITLIFVCCYFHSYSTADKRITICFLLFYSCRLVNFVKINNVSFIEFINCFIQTLFNYFFHLLSWILRNICPTLQSFTPIIFCLLFKGFFKISNHFFDALSTD